MSEEMVDTAIHEEVVMPLLEPENIEENVLDVIDSANVRFYGDPAQRTALLAAYTKYIGEIENPSTTKMNPFTKSPYAPLDEVLNTTRPVLSKHGLAVTQAPMNGEDGKVYAQTILIHECGAMMVFPPFGVPAKNDAQGTIAALTYARRGALNPILATHGEMDDDGNEATGRKGKKDDDPLAKLKADVMAVMMKKSDEVGKEAVFAVCKKVAGVQNPNAIKDEETLNKVKKAVDAIKKEDK